MLRRPPHLLKKSGNYVNEDSEYNFEGGANSELDKDTDGSSFNSKVKSKLSSSVNYLVPVIDFYWVQAIANVGLLFVRVVCA